MEIITYIISGSLDHKDSMGNSGTIAAGDVQRMTAGTGIVHSEFNGSKESVHLLQIWIFPEASESHAEATSNGHLTYQDKRNTFLPYCLP